MAIIKCNLEFAILNMKRTLKSHLRQKYELKKDHTIIFIEFVSYESAFPQKGCDFCHVLQIFYKGHYINRIIYKLFLITSRLLILCNSTNPLAKNLLNCLWLLISFVRNDRDKSTCKYLKRVTKFLLTLNIANSICWLYYVIYSKLLLTDTSIKSDFVYNHISLFSWIILYLLCSTVNSHH